MFFGGFKLQPEKIMTRKKKVQSSGRRLKSMFFGGFKKTTVPFFSGCNLINEGTRQKS
jgi:hypothetical protein